MKSQVSGTQKQLVNIYKFFCTLQPSVENLGIALSFIEKLWFASLCFSNFVNSWPDWIFWRFVLVHRPYVWHPCIGAFTPASNQDFTCTINNCVSGMQVLLMNMIKLHTDPKISKSYILKICCLNSSLTAQMKRLSEELPLLSFSKLRHLDDVRSYSSIIKYWSSGRVLIWWQISWFVLNVYEWC